jgi:hypothetical protein
MSIYHILEQHPAITASQMHIELEQLANELVLSGKFRIDADDKINFTRLSIPSQGINVVFSIRELSDKNLLPSSRKFLTKILEQDLRGMSIEARVELEISQMLKKISKHQPVSLDLELKLARILVQAAHPVVIKMLLYEKVEIFLSYSYNIGDMMDIVSWQQDGSNSGMQSTDGREVAIFVSAGGNPFGSTPNNSIYGDGLPAIARMTIIAAQEIGHYSKEQVRLARAADVANIAAIEADLARYDLPTLAEYERHLKFYKQHKIIGFKVWRTLFSCWLLRSQLNSIILKKYPGLTTKQKYLGMKLFAAFSDMSFNIAPKADVYSRSDKDAQEAILCIEALARVPQQARKWGHNITKALIPNLYSFYYEVVIPACFNNYRNMSGKDYVLKLTTHPLSWVKRIFHKKPPSFMWEYD